MRIIYLSVLFFMNLILFHIKIQLSIQKGPFSLFFYFSSEICYTFEPSKDKNHEKVFLHLSFYFLWRGCFRSVLGAESHFGEVLFGFLYFCPLHLYHWVQPDAAQ